MRAFCFRSSRLCVRLLGDLSVRNQLIRHLSSVICLAVHIEKKYSWQLPDSAVTSESQYLGRRQFLRTFGLGLAAGVFLPAAARAATFGVPDVLDGTYKLPGAKLTPYDDITSYNNFYAWGL